MRECIYCKNLKEEDAFSLEHVIPQFLGGAYASDNLKTRDVCQKCNNDLGLFVDAAFEKTNLVSNTLRLCTHAFFDPENPTPLPLSCWGYSDLLPPEMAEDEVCELWIGSLGEQVYWIRPRDTRMYWYAGGNPRTVKRKKTKAYCLFSERSLKNIELSRLSFKYAFEGRKVEKISCTKIEGCNLSEFGFSEPNNLDKKRIGYLLENTRGLPERRCDIAMNADFDLRFMAKMALGLSHVLFGSNVENSQYSQKLRNGLWFKDGDPEPGIKGFRMFSETDDFMKKQTGVDNGVTITICPSGEAVLVSLNIARKLNCGVMCAEIDDLSKVQVSTLGEGISIVLFKHIEKGIQLPLIELICHNTGTISNPELLQVEKLANKHKNYFQHL